MSAMDDFAAAPDGAEDDLTAQERERVLEAGAWLATGALHDAGCIRSLACRLIARGETVQVMIDPKTGRPRPIAPELRERLKSFAEHWGGPVPE